MSREYYYEEHLKDSKLPKGTKEFLKDCDLILDVGAGTGFAADELKPKRVYCVEKDEKAKEILRQKHLRIIDGTAEKINCLSETYDAVICMDVIEHIVDATKAVKEFHRILKKGGKLVLKAGTDTDNHQWFWDDYTHVRPFTHYSLKLLLTDYNFKCKSIEPVFVDFHGNVFLEGYVAFAEVVK